MAIQFIVQWHMHSALTIARYKLFFVHIFTYLYCSHAITLSLLTEKPDGTLMDARRKQIAINN